jgi:hypothetical protein
MTIVELSASKVTSIDRIGVPFSAVALSSQASSSELATSRFLREDGLSHATLGPPLGAPAASNERCAIAPNRRVQPLIEMAELLKDPWEM